MIVSSEDLSSLVKGGLAIRDNGSDVSIDLVSIGLHLGSNFLRYKKIEDIRPLPFNAPTEKVVPDLNGLVDFPPGAQLLASTEEVVDMPKDCMGFIQTKGTIARGFVTVHLCDGQIDPGFRGRITLELVNFSQFHYSLQPGTAIAQLFIHRISKRLEKGYNGRYQNPDGPTSMRM